MIVPMLTRTQIYKWLREDDADRLAQLWSAADLVRSRTVGPQVHLRGLVELSNYCTRGCTYCGLRAANRDLPRYRMTDDEVLACARQIADRGYGTLVLQAGEDDELTANRIAGLVRYVKANTSLAVTLSLGERTDEELAAWHDAGADRYLLRFETSDRALFDRIHPPRGGRTSDRLAQLNRLRNIGYEIGGGVMIGIPGQTYESLANDIATFAEWDLDMIGVGPFIPHPQTPLGQGRLPREIDADKQAPSNELMVYKVVALARLVRPDANIPATTALASINPKNGRELALMRGANVVMPNFTPLEYRQLYEIYPGKTCVTETGQKCDQCLRGRIAHIGREVGVGPGGRGQHLSEIECANV